MTLRHFISRENQTPGEVCRQEKVSPSPVSRAELVAARLFCFAVLLTFNRPNMEQEIGPSQITGKQISGKCSAFKKKKEKQKRQRCKGRVEGQICSYYVIIYIYIKKVVVPASLGCCLLKHCSLGHKEQKYINVFHKLKKFI